MQSRAGTQTNDQQEELDEIYRSKYDYRNSEAVLQTAGGSGAGIRRALIIFFTALEWNIMEIFH